MVRVPCLFSSRRSPARCVQRQRLPIALHRSSLLNHSGSSSWNFDVRGISSLALYKTSTHLLGAASISTKTMPSIASPKTRSSEYADIQAVHDLTDGLLAGMQLLHERQAAFENSPKARIFRLVLWTFTLVLLFCVVRLISGIVRWLFRTKSGRQARQPKPRTSATGSLRGVDQTTTGRRNVGPAQRSQDPFSRSNS